MLIGAFFSWWYGSGWLGVLKSFEKRTHAVSAEFSVLQLVQTLFAPWRRIITYPGASIAERFKAWGDNVFSRCIGFLVRLFVLAAALIVLVLVLFLTLVELLIWPLVPLAVPGALIAAAII